MNLGKFYVHFIDEKAWLEWVESIAGAQFDAGWESTLMDMKVDSK